MRVQGGSLWQAKVLQGLLQFEAEVCRCNLARGARQGTGWAIGAVGGYGRDQE